MRHYHCRCGNYQRGSFLHNVFMARCPMCLAPAETFVPFPPKFTAADIVHGTQTFKNQQGHYVKGPDGKLRDATPEQDSAHWRDPKGHHAP